MNILAEDDDPEALSPFKGKQGSWLRAAIESRGKRVTECLKSGPAPFEKFKMPGYDQAQMRCRRCLTLKRHHHESATMPVGFLPPKARKE